LTHNDSDDELALDEAHDWHLALRAPIAKGRSSVWVVLARQRSKGPGTHADAELEQGLNGGEHVEQPERPAFLARRHIDLDLDRVDLLLEPVVDDTPGVHDLGVDLGLLDVGRNRLASRREERRWTLGDGQEALTAKAIVVLNLGRASRDVGQKGSA
jgi:hypothetical protein